jgi:uncharacterized Fe-S cluster-containing radical SAM superfamily protein
MLSKVVALRTAAALFRGHSPKQLVIQFTDACNARCPQCGMRADRVFARSRLDYGDVRRILHTAAGQGCLSVSLTGGEPLLYSEQVFQLLEYAHSLGIRYTRTGTNGFVFRVARPSAFERRMATLASRIREANVHTFWISLDSADPARHEQARGLPGVVEGIRRALPVFHAYGVYPSVNLGLNRHMGKKPLEPCVDRETFANQVRGALEDFFNAVLNLGFTMANVCYPMSLGPGDPAAAYQATSDANLVRFTDEERSILFTVLAEVARAYRPRIRVFSPLSSLSALSAQHDGGGRTGEPCRGGVDFFYISASTKQLYPCGFRGTEPLGDPADPASWKSRRRPNCYGCDWECFRDPSQLVAPFTRITRHPMRTARWAAGKREEARLWRQDWSYYSACSYFSSAAPLDSDRLLKFSPH